MYPVHAYFDARLFGSLEFKRKCCFSMVVYDSICMYIYEYTDYVNIFNSCMVIFTFSLLIASYVAINVDHNLAGIFSTVYLSFYSGACLSYITLDVLWIIADSATLLNPFMLGINYWLYKHHLHRHLLLSPY